MKLGELFSSTFRFRKTTLTVITVITYVLVVLLQHFGYRNSLKLPQPEPPLLTEAWDHLQVISSTKHPYTSPNNDYLHDYLETVIEVITDQVTYIQVASDKKDNHTIFINQHDVFDSSNNNNRIIYYESSNLLVKIQGANSNLPGILLSAHYDSVPTSFGTTDDGMGIASMLAVLTHFSSSGKQPLRTLIFNFNNNEEFGLLGAEAFVQHEWFQDVEFFINLEGTGAGGQPILFRGTDKSVIDWYRYVTIPFANSIFQEGFKSGFISSQTDYHVYEKNGLRGLDIAFYLPRSFYHTIRDSIKFTSKESLWMMTSNVLDILDVVVQSKDEYSSDLNFSIYFDILNYWFVNISLGTMFTYNVILLTTIPLIIFILLLIVKKRETWFISARGWIRFPLAALISYYSMIFVTNYFQTRNPLIISTNYMAVGTFLFSLTMLIAYIVLTVANRVTPVHDQKLVIMFEINFVVWVALVVMTYKQRNDLNISGYCFTIVYVLTSLSVIVGLLGMIFRASPCYDESPTTIYVDLPNNNGYEPDEVHNDQNSHDIVDTESQNEQQNEMQPLLGESNVTLVNYDYYMHKLKHQAINNFQYDWLLQFLIYVPLTVFFLYAEGRLILDALADTVLQNTVYDKAVWEFLAYFSVLLALVVTPFSHKISFLGCQILVVMLATSGVISYFTAPFTDEHPIKVRFVQNFDINNNCSSATVYGRSGYVKNILTEVPYISKADLIAANFFNGAEQLTYEGFRPWLLSGSAIDNEYKKYMNISVISNTNIGLNAIDRFTPLESLLSIDITGARQCYMTFNTSNPKFKAPVKMVTFFKEGNEAQSKDFAVPNGMSRDKHGNWIFKVMKGIDLVELHRLSWHSEKSKINTFYVKIQWLPFLYDNDIEIIDKLGVNVQCHWSDYDDVVVVDGVQHPKVKNFIDILQFTDQSVSWENLRPGLVQGNGYIEV